MIRVCCSHFHVGDKVFGKKKPFGDNSETHGFCFSCFKKEMDRYRRGRRDKGVISNDARGIDETV